MDNLHRACRKAIYHFDNTISDKVQIKVREVTSKDPWGPTAHEMAEIAEASFTKAPIILCEIWNRLEEDCWQHVFKSLILLDYLIKHGPDSIAKYCWQNLDRLRELQSYPHVEGDRNPAHFIREKAQKVLALIGDSNKLAQERAKAKRIRERVPYKDPEFLHFFRGVPPDLSCGGDTITIEKDSGLVPPQTAEEEAFQLQLAIAASNADAREEMSLRENAAPIAQEAFERTLVDNGGSNVTKKLESTGDAPDLIDLSPNSAADSCAFFNSLDNGPVEVPGCNEGLWRFQNAPVAPPPVVMEADIMPRRKVVIPPPTFFCSYLSDEADRSDYLTSPSRELFTHRASFNFDGNGFLKSDKANRKHINNHGNLSNLSSWMDLREK